MKLSCLFAGLAIFAGNLLLTGSAIGKNIADEQQLNRIRQIVLSRGENPAALAQLIQLARELEPPEGAKLYHQLADDYLRRGLYDQAGGVLQQMVKQYPEEPLALESLLTSVRIYSSGEVFYRLRPKAKVEERVAAANFALSLAEQGIQQRTELGEDPRLAFQCAVAARLGEKLQTSQRWLTPLKHHTRSQPWNDRAQRESLLKEGKSPALALHCPTTDERPHLDGVLDDPLWQSAGVALIDGEVKNIGTQIRLARDGEFLYLALRCEKDAGFEYRHPKLPRQHDADLKQQDRVELRLDLDRDYATAFELAIDHRGQTSDTCWLDRTWNPRWFVAVKQDDRHWSIEAAIAWEELVPAAPRVGEAWALSVRRVIPGRQAANWSDDEQGGSDDFGLLLFE